MVSTEDNLIVGWIGRFFQMSFSKISTDTQGFLYFFPQGSLQDKNYFHNNTEMVFALLTVLNISADASKATEAYNSGAST